MEYESSNSQPSVHRTAWAEKNPSPTVEAAPGIFPFTKPLVDQVGEDLWKGIQRAKVRQVGDEAGEPKERIKKNETKIQNKWYDKTNLY